MQTYSFMTDYRFFFSHRLNKADFKNRLHIFFDNWVKIVETEIGYILSYLTDISNCHQ